jgi:hypothetical protein
LNERGETARRLAASHASAAFNEASAPWNGRAAGDRKERETKNRVDCRHKESVPSHFLLL